MGSRVGVGGSRTVGASVTVTRDGVSASVKDHTSALGIPSPSPDGAIDGFGTTVPGDDPLADPFTRAFHNYATRTGGDISSQ